MDLRPYQNVACERILAELRTVRATLLVLATGLGKTVVFSAIARHVVGCGGRVLVLAHRKELLAQARLTLVKHGLAADIEQADKRASPAASVVVASVPTMRGDRLAGFAPNTFSLIVVDEAHHATAKGYGRILSYFSSAKVLGVTATPDRTDGKGLGRVFESLAYRMEVESGIREGYLSPVRLQAITIEGLDLSTVPTVAGELHQGEVEQAFDDMTDAQWLPVAAAIVEQAGDRPTLVFVPFVKTAYRLAELLRVRGASAKALDGTSKPAERAEVLEGYQLGKVQFVVNAMLLTEGFDAPHTSCVVLLRPTTSRSLVAQMIGRGTRIAEGKTDCLILDFVPARAPKIRLASPEDVLCDRELDDEVKERVAQLQLDGDMRAYHELVAEAEEQIANERAAAAANLEYEKRRSITHRREWLRKVGVVYAVATLPTSELLSAICPNIPGDRLASAAQREALVRMGYEVEADLSMRQASKLFDIARERRERGLCTLKQSRFLAKKGLRGDLTMDEATRVIDEIQSNGWGVPQHVVARYRAPESAAQA